MRHPRLPVLVPALLSLLALPLAAPLMAADATGPATQPAPALSADQQKFWADAQQGNGELARAQIEAEAKYVQARAEFANAHFVEAREAVEAALRLYPSHEAAQALRQDILAVLSRRDNRLQMAATWFHALQDVKTQEIAVRLAALMESAGAKSKAGDFAGAELDYDRVDVGLRSFPYQFDWGKLPAEVEAKRLEARNQARTAAVARQEQNRDDARRNAEQQSDLQEEALKNKVDELLRRARASYDRKDYKRAEVDAWNAYELDRRREDARSLYLSARRSGHVQFDDRYREERLERLARVHEEIHKALIPQNELLVYPEDWQVRALRKAQEIGSNQVEPWVAQLKDKLEQRVTFEFADQSFDDVITFLRQVTNTTIITAPDVVGGGGAGNVTLRVKDMRFGDALKWILELTGLHMALQNQAIYISKAPITGAVTLRMYDVTDLVLPIGDFPGRELAYNAGAGGMGGGGGFSLFKGGMMEAAAATGRPADPAALMDFIKSNVAKDTWDKEGIAIDQRGGQTLFVSQSPEVHTLIDQLLTNLRNQGSLQVHVSVQVLDVRKGFFEEIGVEYTDPAAAAGSANNPSGRTIIGGSSDHGYERLNDTLSYQGDLNNVLPANSTKANFNGINKGLTIDGSYHGGSFLRTDQINAIFSAVEQETDAQILEHPSITCFNGQRANAAFIHQYAYIADYDIVNFTYDPKIEVLNYGDLLDVRPVVSSDRKYITMEIRPSSVVPEEFFVEILRAPRFAVGGNFLVVLGINNYPIELPNVEVRTMRSTVMMPDKGTLLIGGFSQALRQNTHSGIPFLSHIPFLGRLFSKNGVYDENRKIFFMLNAEILDLGEKEKMQ